MVTSALVSSFLLFSMLKRIHSLKHSLPPLDVNDNKNGKQFDSIAIVPRPLETPEGKINAGALKPEEIANTCLAGIPVRIQHCKTYMKGGIVEKDVYDPSIKGIHARTRCDPSSVGGLQVEDLVDRKKVKGVSLGYNLYYVSYTDPVTKEKTMRRYVDPVHLDVTEYPRLEETLITDQTKPRSDIQKYLGLMGEAGKRSKVGDSVRRTYRYIQQQQQPQQQNSNNNKPEHHQQQQTASTASSVEPSAPSSKEQIKMHKKTMALMSSIREKSKTYREVKKLKQVLPPSLLSKSSSSFSVPHPPSTPLKENTQSLVFNSLDKEQSPKNISISNASSTSTDRENRTQFNNSSLSLSSLSSLPSQMSGPQSNMSTNTGMGVGGGGGSVGAPSSSTPSMSLPTSNPSAPLNNNMSGSAGNANGAGANTFNPASHLPNSWAGFGGGGVGGGNNMNNMNNNNNPTGGTNTGGYNQFSPNPNQQGFGGMQNPAGDKGLADFIAKRVEQELQQQQQQRAASGAPAASAAPTGGSATPSSSSATPSSTASTPSDTNTSSAAASSDPAEKQMQRLQSILRNDAIPLEFRNMVRDFASDAYRENDGLNEELYKIKEAMGQLTASETQRTRALSELLANTLADQFKKNQQHNPTGVVLTDAEKQALVEAIEKNTTLQDTYAKQFYNSDFHDRAEPFLAPHMKKWFAEQRIMEREAAKQRQQQTYGAGAGVGGGAMYGGGGGETGTYNPVATYNSYARPVGMDDPYGIYGIPHHLQSSYMQQQQQRQPQTQQQLPQQQQQTGMGFAAGGNHGGSSAPTQQSFGGNNTYTTMNTGIGGGAGVGVGGGSSGGHADSKSTTDFFSDIKKKIDAVHKMKPDFSSYAARFPTTNNVPAPIGNPYAAAGNANLNQSPAQYQNSSLSHDSGTAQYTNSSMPTGGGGTNKRKMMDDTNPSIPKSTLRVVGYDMNVAQFEPSLMYRPLTQFERNFIELRTEN